MSILASKVSSDVMDVQVLEAELIVRLSDGRTRHIRRQLTTWNVISRAITHRYDDPKIKDRQIKIL